MTELKLYHGAWTAGVISTPAKGATYQVALEIELGATLDRAQAAGYLPQGSGWARAPHMWLDPNVRRGGCMEKVGF